MAKDSPKLVAVVAGPARALAVALVAGQRGEGERFDLAQVVFGYSGPRFWCAATDSKIMARMDWPAGEKPEEFSPFGIPAEVAGIIVGTIPPNERDDHYQFRAELFSDGSLTLSAGLVKITCTAPGRWPVDAAEGYRQSIAQAVAPSGKNSRRLQPHVLQKVCAFLEAVAPEGEWMAGFVEVKPGVDKSAVDCWVFEIGTSLDGKGPPGLAGCVIAMPLKTRSWHNPKEGASSADDEAKTR